MNDLTVIYLTANVISDTFMGNTLMYLHKAIGDTPIISVSKKPMGLGENICFNTPRSHINIYREALAGAKAAKTKYIAIVEDDTLYTPEHFKYRPLPETFAYNVGCWSIYTWVKPAIFSYKGRRNHNGLICERDLYIDTLEERFKAYPIDEEVDLSKWAEPGRYELNLHLPQRKTETFHTVPPNIMFTHETGSSHGNLGYRKKLGNLRANEIPYWGRAEDIIRLYE